MPKVRSSHIPSLATIERQLDSVFGLTLTTQVHYYKVLIDRLVARHGVKPACQYLKSLYAQALRLASGLKPEPIPFRRAAKDGFDRNLTPFRRYLSRGSPAEKRACLTVLRLCYLLEAPPVLDLTSIESEAKTDGVLTMIADFTRFARDTIPRVSVEGVIDMPPRARSGPNGPSGFATAHLDAVALHQRPELLQALSDLATLIDPLNKGEPKSTPLGNVLVSNPDGSATEATNGCGNPPDPERELGLKPWIDSLTAWAVRTWSLDPNKRFPVSRLALLSEGGCKTRTIAIVDLFTQAVLRPIHVKIMKRLSSMPSDCTHNQMAAVDYLKQVTLEGKPVYSFDLTNATDRFPLELQKVVVSAMFGDQVGVLWGKVIAELRDFSYKDAKTSFNNIYYKRGQPMGAYSSWPAFAFTHHILLRWCGRIVSERTNPGRSWHKTFIDYRIIGDDVIIADELVAEEYRAMLELLEVPISTSKSMVSKGTETTAGEIAKRFVVGGMDLSPIPPDLVRLVQRHVTMLPAYINEISSRYGLGCSTLLCMQSLANLYKHSSKRRKASILLAAPAVFALYGYPYYGPLLRGNEPSEESQQLLAIVEGSPWTEVGLETIANDLNLVQVATREEYYLRQYDEVIKSWTSDNEVYIQPPRGMVSNTKTTPPSDHPILKANTWICERQRDILISHAKWRSGASLQNSPEDLAIAMRPECSLRFTIDPSLRSFLTRTREESNTATHLTLEVLRVLRGDKKFPNYNQYVWDQEYSARLDAVAALEDPDNPVSPNPLLIFSGNKRWDRTRVRLLLSQWRVRRQTLYPETPPPSLDERDLRRQLGDAYYVEQVPMDWPMPDK